jgi:endonuclease/exonuclease/phosphatase (EEP) superfamily protein YafD
VASAVLTALAWLVAILLAAWAIVRGLGLERTYPLVPLVAFTPYVAGLALVVAAVLALLRRPAPAVLAAVAGAVLAALVIPRAIGDEDADGVPLTVMTANVKLGDANAQALTALVREQGVDVLTVQELTVRLARDLRESGLDRELPHTVLAPGPLSAGGGLYSRLPVRELTEAPNSLAGPQPAAALRLPGAREVRVYSFHPPPPTGPDATREWASDIGTLPDPEPGEPPVIVAGDFNATLDHARLREAIDLGYRDAGERAGIGLSPTWPNGRVFPPQVTIDHVLADERIGVAAARVRDVPDSDHRAVIAELLVPPGSPGPSTGR